MQQAADFQDVLPLNTVILRVFMGSRRDQTSTYREITVKATKPKQDQEIPRSENTQWLEEYLGGNMLYTCEVVAVACHRGVTHSRHFFIYQDMKYD